MSCPKKEPTSKMGEVAQHLVPLNFTNVLGWKNIRKQGIVCQVAARTGCSIRYGWGHQRCYNNSKGNNMTHSTSWRWLVQVCGWYLGEPGVQSTEPTHVDEAGQVHVGTLEWAERAVGTGTGLGCQPKSWT